MNIVFKDKIMAYSSSLTTLAKTLPSSSGATIIAKSNFNALDACKSLKKAIKGLGLWLLPSS